MGALTPAAPIPAMASGRRSQTRPTAPQLTTTTREAPQLACSPEEVMATITTDKADYLPGEIIIASASVRNVSHRACYPWTNTGVRWLDQTGTAVVPSGILHRDCFGMCDPDFLPGEVQTATFCWSQQVGSGFIQAPPGRYSVSSRWNDIEAAASFELTAGPVPSTSTTVAHPQVFACPGDPPLVFPGDPPSPQANSEGSGIDQ